MEDSYTKRYKIALYLICRNHIISRNQIDGIVKIPSDDIDVTALDVMTSIIEMVDIEHGGDILEQACKKKIKWIEMEYGDA